MTGGGLTVTVKAGGAELCSLRDAAGDEYLWQATPPWPRHAPILFPIVGRLKDDTLRHDGVSYRMTQHGFARDRIFSWVSRDGISCRLVLTDDAESRAIYPFAFRFEVAYALGADGLSISYTIINTGTEILPASMGAHPAFRWPLRDGVPKEAHRLVFETDEIAPMRGVIGGLLTPPTRPSPIENSVLALRPALFAEDALILDHPRSTWVRYGAPGTPTLRVSWEGFPQLGIWSRADADLLCIEPWLGMASPADFDGDFLDKPWVVHLAPGEQRTARHRMMIEA